MPNAAANLTRHPAATATTVVTTTMPTTIMTAKVAVIADFRDLGRRSVQVIEDAARLYNSCVGFSWANDLCNRNSAGKTEQASEEMSSVHGNLHFCVLWEGRS